MTLLKTLWLILVAFLLIVILLFCWILETFAMYFSNYPQAYVVALLLGIALTYPTLRKTATRKISAGLLTIFTLALISVQFSPFLLPNPVKPYRSFYNSIQPGMTIVQVKQQLDQYFPANGPVPKPVCRDYQQDQTTVFGCQLDPNNGLYNAEIVSVYFEHDRVTRKDYSAD